MSQVLTAKEICERALRAIGAFPVTDSAADGEQLREAMSWLDLYMGEFAGGNEIFFLVQQQLPIVITNGTGTYDLDDALGANLPIDGTQFPIEAWLLDRRASAPNYQSSPARSSIRRASHPKPAARA